MHGVEHVDQPLVRERAGDCDGGGALVRELATYLREARAQLGDRDDGGSEGLCDGGAAARQASARAADADAGATHLQAQREGLVIHVKILSNQLTIIGSRKNVIKADYKRGDGCAYIASPSLFPICLEGGKICTI